LIGGAGKTRKDRCACVFKHNILAGTSEQPQDIVFFNTWQQHSDCNPIPFLVFNQLIKTSPLPAPVGSIPPGLSLLQSFPLIAIKISSKADNCVDSVLYRG